MINFSTVRRMYLHIFEERILDAYSNYNRAQLSKNKKRIDEAKSHLNSLIRQMIQVANAISPKYIGEYIKEKGKKALELSQDERTKINCKRKGCKKEVQKKFEKNITTLNKIIKLGLETSEKMNFLIDELDYPFNEIKNLNILKDKLLPFYDHLKKMDEKEYIEKPNKEDLEKINKEAELSNLKKIADDIFNFFITEKNGGEKFAKKWEGEKGKKSIWKEVKSGQNKEGTIKEYNEENPNIVLMAAHFLHSNTFKELDKEYEDD